MKLSHAYKITRKALQETYDDVASGDLGKLGHRYSFYIRQLWKDLPRDITVEPSNFCNFNCEFCSTPPELTNRPKRNITLDEFKRVVDKVQPVTYSLWLFLAGEPLLNKHFPDMVAYATKKNLKTSTSTNASLLTSRTSAALIDAKIDRLIISVDGMSKETYEAMRRGGRYERVKANIEELVRLKEQKRARKPRVEIQMLVSKINEHETEDFQRWTKKLGVDYLLKTISVPEWVLNENESQQVKEKYLPKQDKSRTRYRDKEALELKKYPDCRQTKRTIIFSNGDVTLCCYDPSGTMAIGNVFRNDFVKLWNSPAYKKLREAGKNRKLPLCKKCGETYDVF